MAENFSGVISFAASSADELSAELVRVSKRLSRILDIQFASYDIRNGRFTRSAENIGRLVDAREQVQNAIVESGYPKAIKKYVAKVPELQAKVLDAWRNLGLQPAFRTVDIEAIKIIRGAVLDTFANISDQGADIIRSNLIQAVTSGRSYREFSDELTDFLRGSGDLRDQAGVGMFRHANTLAQTAMDQLSATMDAQLAVVAGIEKFRYVGGVIKTTREFCRHLNGKILTRDQIDALDNGQTGTGSVLVSRGGWNCRHRWLPVVEM